MIINTIHQMKKDKEEALLKKREEAERKVRIVNSHQPCHYLRGCLFESFSLVCKCFLLELWSFPVEWSSVLCASKMYLVFGCEVQNVFNVHIVNIENILSRSISARKIFQLYIFLYSTLSGKTRRDRPHSWVHIPLDQPGETQNKCIIATKV